MKTDVLIVGAGPSGLMLGATLARHGVSFRIIDQTAAPTEESRANIVHMRTLELLDKFGLAQDMIARGVKIRGAVVRARGKRIAYIPFSGKAIKPAAFDHSLGIKQGEVQRVLLQDMEANGGAVDWNTTFLRQTETAAGVLSILRNDKTGAEEEVESRFLIAADGGRSPVRQSVGIELEGSTYEQVGFLADVQLAHDPAPERMTLNMTKGGFVGIIPLSGDRQFRLFGAVSPRFLKMFDGRGSQAATREEIQAWFDEVFFLENTIVTAGWSAIYRIHRRMAPRFDKGAIHIIGDAGHIHAPAGGQGMNLGIGDAFNLGWKLAAFCRGQARRDLIATYDEERRPLARQILDGADKGFELEATNNSVLEWVRTYIAPTMMRVVAGAGVMRRIFVGLFSQIWISYRRAPQICRAPSGYRGPAPGDRVPYIACEGPNGERTSHDLLAGLDHVLLAFAPSAGAVEDVSRAAAQMARATATTIRIRTLSPSRANAGFYKIMHARRAPYVLVRPDGHVAAAGEEAIRDYLERWFVGRAPDVSAPAAAEPKAFAPPQTVS